MSESPNDPLRKQVDEAKRHPAGSRERLKALAKLISLLKSSGKLSRPHRGKFQGFYKEIYDDALNRTFTYVCDRIDTYSSEKGTVLAWVNFYLGTRFFNEASREFMRTRPGGAGSDVQCLSLDDLDVPTPNALSHGKSLLEDLIEYIREDPGGVFKDRHVQGHPQANFQYIALQRLEYRARWEELADELGISAQTLSSFYQRSFQHFKQKIRDDLL
ncbi:sigma-70 family RNA polymerase sigma factor [Adonisia turfae]|nr:sigma-70 family RNA polymerase sigma factor [Adonisia turfae]